MKVIPRNLSRQTSTVNNFHHEIFNIVEKNLNKSTTISEIKVSHPSETQWEDSEETEEQLSAEEVLEGNRPDHFRGPKAKDQKLELRKLSVMLKNQIPSLAQREKEPSGMGNPQLRRLGMR